MGALLSGIVVTVVLGCGDNTDSPTAIRAVAEVRLATENITMEVDVQHAARASAVDAAGLPLEGERTTWSVTDSTIASVTPSGTVISRSLGSTTLTASSNGFSGSARIDVVASASLPLSECALVGRGPESHVTPAHAQPSVGELKVVMLFADFPGAPGREHPNYLLELLVPKAQAWFREVSRGKFSLSGDAVGEWLHRPKPFDEYDWAGFEGHRHYTSEVVSLADPTVDFSPYDAVFIVASDGTSRQRSNAFHARPGTGVEFDGGEIRSAVTFGTGIRDPLPDFGAFVTVHEASHLLGLPDLYLFGGTTFQQTSSAVGMWDPMGWLGLGTHFVSWHKWKLGWLRPGRIDCLGRASLERTLVPFDIDTGTQALVIPTHSWRALVVEVRRARGFDSRSCEEGILIYAVDVDVPTGHGPIDVRSARRDRDAELSRGGACGPLYESTYGLGGDRISQFVDNRSWETTVEVIEEVGEGYRVRVNRS